jgi:hypothetical protein
LSVDYNVFVHLSHGALESGALESDASESSASESGQVVAQDDGAPGAGHYATSLWRPGDEIVDEHIVDASYDPQQDQLVVGWYEWSSMRHLGILDENGELGTDRYVLHPSHR